MSSQWVHSPLPQATPKVLQHISAVIALSPIGSEHSPSTYLPQQRAVMPVSVTKT